MKKVLPEIAQSWLNQFRPRILFPHQINDFSLFWVILRQEKTYQALIAAPSRQHVAETLLENLEQGAPVNWPWTKGPKDYRKNLSIIRLLQGDFVPDCEEILILGRQQSTAGNLPHPKKLVEFQPSKSCFHGNWWWSWPRWLCIPDESEFILEIPVFNYQTDELFLIRCLYRNEIGSLQYLGWKFHASCSGNSQDIQTQWSCEPKLSQKLEVEEWLVSEVGSSEEEWGKSNHAQREEDRHRSWLQRLSQFKTLNAQFSDDLD
tara:strand:+ start:1276 stop:2061 length:786 start_codon:yes stop_codon:yes gene_type:complete